MSGNMKRVAVTPGTGIGPEVTAQALRVVESFATKRGLPLDVSHPPSGPDAWRRFGTPMPDATLDTLRQADAIIFGAASSTCSPICVRWSRTRPCSMPRP